MTDRPETAPRILLVAKDYPPTAGGVETYSAEVARAYHRAGCEVVVLTQQAQEPRSEDEDFPVVRVRRGPQPVVAIRLLLALLRLRLGRRVDLVHATTWRVGVPARVVFAGVPTWVTVHGREIIHFPRAVAPLLRWLFKRVDGVIAVSHATAALLDDAGLVGPQTQTVVRWNGITWPKAASEASTARSAPSDLPSGPESEVVPGSQGRPLRVLTLARLVPRKNIDTCITAVARLRREGIDVRLTVGGRGPELGHLEQLVSDLDLGQAVVFAGYVPTEDIPSLYREHDVFLHPHSHLREENEFEGFGIVIADAMSFGCAVISGDDGGPGDYITPGETGLLVSGGDAHAVTDALRTLALDAGTRERIARAGRAYALAEFDWDQHVGPAMEHAVMPSSPRRHG